MTSGTSPTGDFLLKAVDSGHRALLVSGNVHDLFVVGEEITYRPFAVVREYTEPLAPAVHTSGASADEHTFVAEGLHVLANAPALRKSGNLLVCLVRDGFQNILLNDLHRVDIPLPEETQMSA